MTELADSLTIDLRKALTEQTDSGERSITQLQLREPTGGEMRDAEGLKLNVPVTIRVVALVTGLKEATVRGLPSRDLKRAGDYLSAFVLAPERVFETATLPSTLDFPLASPLLGPTGAVAVISLSEPTAGQLEEFEHLDGWARRVKSVATVAALPESVVGRIAVRPLADMGAYLDAFFA
jgi:hypothetical protein